MEELVNVVPDTPVGAVDRGRIDALLLVGDRANVRVTCSLHVVPPYQWLYRASCAPYGSTPEPEEPLCVREECVPEGRADKGSDEDASKVANGPRASP